MALAGMRLWMQRHAPVLCAPGLCYGASDLSADPAHTAEAAARIAAALPAGVALWTSPRVRCTVLAEAVARLRPDLGAVRTDARLAEMDFGAWEGRPWSAIARSEFDAWLADFADARPGGHGESTRAFMQRVAAAWDDWRSGGRDAAWFTHAGVMRAAGLVERGRRTVHAASDWPQDAIGHGEWHCLGGSRQPGAGVLGL